MLIPEEASLFKRQRYVKALTFVDGFFACVREVLEHVVAGKHGGRGERRRDATRFGINRVVGNRHCLELKGLNLIMQAPSCGAVIRR